MSPTESTIAEKDIIVPSRKELPPSSEDGLVTIPEELPILPLKGVVFFPQLMLPLVVGRSPSIQVVDDALQGNKMIALVTQRDEEVQDPEPKDLHSVGTAGVIEKMFKLPDDSVRLVVRGIARIEVTEVIATEPYLRAKVRELKEDLKEEDLTAEAMAGQIRTDFNKLADLSTQIPSELGVMALNISEPGLLADLVGSSLNVGVDEKQDLLETLSVHQRLRKTLGFLTKELQILELGQKIHDQIRETMDETQREYYLREQMRAIQKELGEEDEHSVEMEELREKITKAGMPEPVEKEAFRELDRLSRMSPSAAEYTVSRTYLDWLVELPWSIETEDNLDIKAAEKILNEDQKISRVPSSVSRAHRASVRLPWDAPSPGPWGGNLFGFPWEGPETKQKFEDIEEPI
jgi:ATP-dependent Lon protease